MIYRVEIHNPEGTLLAIIEQVSTPAFFQALNEAKTFSVTVPADDDNLNFVTANNLLWLRDMRSGAVVGKFKLLTREDIRQGGSIFTKIEAADQLTQLNDELIPSYDTGEEGKPVPEIVADLLAFQVAEVPITIGTIEPEVTRAVSVEGDYILPALLRLRETVGGYISVDDGELNWYYSVGEQKGQQIRYRKNLAGIRRRMDFSSFGNRLYCYGAGEGTARIKLSDADGQDEDYVEDTASQDSYGIVIKRLVDKSITHPDTLLAWANQKLNEMSVPVIAYSLDMVDLAAVKDDFSFEALQLGSIVTVIDEDLGINVEARVISINRRDLTAPHNVEVEISNRTKDFVDILGEVYDVQQLGQHIATNIGAGQVIVKGVFTVADWVSEGTTNIAGDHIRTGVIQANNYPDNGIWIDLDNGLIKIGGEDDPVLEWDGENLTIQGNVLITGYIQVGHAADDVNTYGTTISGGKITTGTITALQLTVATAVITSHVQIANAVIKTAHIDNLQIVDAHINDLSASKISAGDISTDRMSLNAGNAVNAGGVVITGSKISITGHSLGELSGSLDNIVDGVTYKRVTVSDMSTWNGKPDDMDEIAMGTTWRKVLADQVTVAGYLNLNANTVKNGEWYNTSGVIIDATKGVRIYGTDMAFATFANQTDARNGTNWQCKMGSDGKLYAGAGNVELGSSGIIIYGQLLKFYYGASQTGVIGSAGASDWTFAASTGRQLWLTTVYGYPIYLSAGSGVYLQANTNIEIEASEGVIITAAVADSPSAGYVKISAYYDVNITAGDDINLTATDNIMLVASGEFDLSVSEYIDLHAGGAYSIRAYSTFRPSATNTYDLGESSYRFAHSYARPILDTTYVSEIDGELLMVGDATGDLWLYSNGAWRQNTS